MAKKNRIVHQELNTTGRMAESVKSRNVPNDPLILISFKLLDLHGNPKFSTIHCEDGYVLKLLGRLKDLNMTALSVFRTPHSGWRSHEIKWIGTSEPKGFIGLPSQMMDYEAWQFQLTTNEHGRVHGLLTSDTFYVVWIDPCHLLFSKQKWCDTHPKPA